ncbi:uncharacterized protein LOC114647572 [Erpetoichthys calabaricus]|uniref:uncharacterized protein LOC114647572 n=1 Tax=Erpetoichthys calabaricus TaxID=27687 RepID=UPI0022342642|nr:uncharacterized protein LOC114647572 [Erpetoichthys calabaricus]
MRQRLSGLPGCPPGMADPALAPQQPPKESTENFSKSPSPPSAFRRGTRPRRILSRIPGSTVGTAESPKTISGPLGLPLGLPGRLMAAKLVIYRNISAATKLPRRVPGRSSDLAEQGQGDETDNEVIIQPRWSMNRDNLEDTLPLCHSSPREESKPDQQKISVPISEKQLDKCTTETSTSSSSLTGSQCYSNYVDFYSPIVIEDKENSSEEESENIVSIKDPSVDVKAILSDLAMQILPNKVSKFNINRGDLWEGALRGFKRQSYDPTYTMLVKFTDDYGVNEDGIDAGGPKKGISTVVDVSHKMTQFT